MQFYTTVSCCCLAQWALDFNGNLHRIQESIRIAKELHAKYRIGPELEICGYGCEDHSWESDTQMHSWEVLAEILKGDLTNGIVCDIGMPVIHENVAYNCRVICLNQKILLIRPKINLADDGFYRESRWFTAWSKGYVLVDHVLPKIIRDITGQQRCKFGVGSIRFSDTMLGSETCEELFTPENPGIVMGLAGCEILGNGSASHHLMGKLSRRLELIQEATRKSGGLYLYSNQQGCDGSRLYFDGTAIIVMNGIVLAQGTQFSLREVEVITATVDLGDIANYRIAIASRGVQAAKKQCVPYVDVEWYLSHQSDVSRHVTHSIEPKLLTPEEQTGYGPACWVWDYLRRSGLRGIVLALSGGKKSGAVAAVVAILFQLLYQTIKDNEAAGIGQSNTKLYSPPGSRSMVLAQLRHITQDPAFDPKSPQDIAKKLFFTCYMKTRYSSEESLTRARALANDIGANFNIIDIDPIIQSALNCWSQVSGSQTPDMETALAKSTQWNAISALQGRTRMVMSYLCSQLTTFSMNPKNPSAGHLLVLGSSILDDGIKGCFHKYDCSSADINPIGAVSMGLLIKFLKWCGSTKSIPSCTALADVPSETEDYPKRLRGSPLVDSEKSMGMTFKEFDEIAKLRGNGRCGPCAMFRKLILRWEHLDAQVIGDRIKWFFTEYGAHRHKVTVLTPSYHLAAHAADDNRNDLRQFLYNNDWTWQFAALNKMIKRQKEAVHARTKRGRKEDAYENTQPISNVSFADRDLQPMGLNG